MDNSTNLPPLDEFFSRCHDFESSLILIGKDKVAKAAEYGRHLNEGYEKYFTRGKPYWKQWVEKVRERGLNERSLERYRLIASEINFDNLSEFSGIVAAFRAATASKAIRRATEIRAEASALPDDNPGKEKAEQKALRAEDRAESAKAKANKAAEQDEPNAEHRPFDVISGDDEWYTPPEIVDAARRCMGGIDLDPASNEWAQSWISAGRYFTEEDDGLEKEWSGRVWMNPPYSRGLIGKFVNKLVESPDVTRAVVITGPYFDTAYGQALLRASSSLCLVSGRIKFLKRTGVRDSPPFASMLHGIRVSHDAFRSAFSEIGDIWAR